ncbi:hypothetical protein DPMN_182857 [Dreissena polymorpha]|uniref:Uncharacterized protein n=1 Tax=Dreissena polymorpha TaxID=45954 RepID=A0A9D4DF03_DREPO|nr:hypothetical protein DPMN_182857 [Dreissena polymorpha]
MGNENVQNERDNSKRIPETRNSEQTISICVKGTQETCGRKSHRKCQTPFQVADLFH